MKLLKRYCSSWDTAVDRVISDKVSDRVTILKTFGGISRFFVGLSFLFYTTACMRYENHVDG